MRPSLCPTVLIRDARGAAVKASEAKICELERAEEKIYMKKVSAVSVCSPNQAALLSASVQA